MPSDGSSPEVTQQDIEEVQKRLQRVMEILASDHPNHPIELQLQHISTSLGGERDDIYPDSWD